MRTTRKHNANTRTYANNAKIKKRSFAVFAYNSHHSHYAQGITLLLVILVLTSLLSISLGIFTSVFTELRISGEIADSFVALYAADEAIERGLYLDRNPATPLCTPNPLTIGSECHYIGDQVGLANGSCYILKADKTVTSVSATFVNFDVNMRASGEFRCGGGITSVKRALQTGYSQSLSLPPP